MLKFEEVTYMFKLDSFADGRVLDIRTNKGNATVDELTGRYFPFSVGEVGAIETPSYFIRDGYMLYLMKEEPQFYA